MQLPTSNFVQKPLDSIHQDLEKYIYFLDYWSEWGKSRGSRQRLPWEIEVSKNQNFIETKIFNLKKLHIFTCFEKQVYYLFNKVIQEIAKVVRLALRPQRWLEKKKTRLRHSELSKEDFKTLKFDQNFPKHLFFQRSFIASFFIDLLCSENFTKMIYSKKEHNPWLRRVCVNESCSKCHCHGLTITYIYLIFLVWSFSC